jgi:hypothetical protein
MSKYSRELKRQELEKQIEQENTKLTDSVQKREKKERGQSKSAPDRKINSTRKKSMITD